MDLLPIVLGLFHFLASQVPSNYFNYASASPIKPIAHTTSSQFSHHHIPLTIVTLAPAQPSHQRNHRTPSQPFATNETFATPSQPSQHSQPNATIATIATLRNPSQHSQPLRNHRNPFLKCIFISYTKLVNTTTTTLQKSKIITT